MNIINFLKRDAQKSQIEKRRRSNWYIYLISFAATFVLLGLFTLAFRDTLFPQTRSSTVDWQGMLTYSPDAELDTTILFMLSDEQGSVPHKYLLLNYRPRDEVISIVPLSQDTRIETRNNSERLADLYSRGGANVTKAGIVNTLGIPIEFYVKFDRASFTGFTAPLGLFSVNVPFPFSESGLTLNVGEHLISGGDLFTYITFADFAEVGTHFNLAIIGQSLTSFINSNLRNMDVESIQSAFNRVLNNASTNMTFRDYISYQRALYHTSTNSINPAEFYIPTGEQEDTLFVISNQSIANINSRFNVQTE
ncbi:MAG: LCP family protein [Oscillospiraceae bacterium]|nr:LCP family protein [Oscillospiraceae bacterium]